MAFKEGQMKHHVRAAVAYVAGRASGRHSSTVYDYNAGEYRSMSGTVTTSRISIYDYKAACYLQGSSGGSKFNLFHYGQSAYVSFQLNGSTFKGYDYGSGNHYMGKVNGHTVWVYDYGEGAYFSYSV